MNKYFIFYFGVIFSLMAQDDLFDLINEESVAPVPVTATFKATRIVNSQSIELARPKTLEFMILHRFGSMKNGVYDLFGMDEAAIRFDLKYGINDRISTGAGRSSLKKTYDIFSKIKLMNQSNVFPFSIALFADIEIETLKRENKFSDKLVNRLTYDTQLLMARKFNQNLSLQIMPTWVHHNLVKKHKDAHDLYSMGVGGRMKITKRVSLNADTFFPVGERDSTFVQSWGIGCDIETGGHVFQIMVTNVQGSFESAYIENASGAIADKNLYLGFNITRVFAI
tara:strand:- start:51 stop:896 length:846 start_codon:yes stop_codon:yes gene_type:complete